ncbi:MAG: spermidine synthase [Planctomycetota bacterium]
MKPWVCIDSAAVPGGGELHLWQHVTGFAIRAGPHELMNSRAHASEDALADLARERQGPRPRAHILIGGLGMGFTAAAALRDLDAESRITVAELVPAVVEWNRGPLAALNGHVLEDPRVHLVLDDVAALMRGHRATYDQLLLDIDNGPAGLCTGTNDWHYSPAGLACAHAALREGGILAVWSAVPDAAFTARLQRAGFTVTLARVRAHGGRGAHHHIWLAARSDDGSS